MQKYKFYTQYMYNQKSKKILKFHHRSFSYHSFQNDVVHSLKKIRKCDKNID